MAKIVVEKGEKVSQKFDYFFVLDFEATCSSTDPKWKNEIIEFPMVVLDAKTGKIHSEFREYVKPEMETKLTKFCTTLTGITQETVDKAETFSEVFQKVMKFLNIFKAENVGKKWIFVTCGDWDLRKMLPLQAEKSGIKIPKEFTKWINIKAPFRSLIKDHMGGECKGVGMPQMLYQLDLPLLGRHHSGLDDSRNIAAITWELISRGVVLEQTGTTA